MPPRPPTRPKSALRISSSLRPARSAGRSRQRALFCLCGQGTPLHAGLCPRCYRARAHSRTYFAGRREEVLARDGGVCRGCGQVGLTQPHVHHRRPGTRDAAELITLCARCHARIHHLYRWRVWAPPALLELWLEQHPGAPLQLQLALVEAPWNWIA